LLWFSLLSSLLPLSSSWFVAFFALSTEVIVTNFILHLVSLFDQLIFEFLTHPPLTQFSGIGIAILLIGIGIVILVIIVVVAAVVVTSMDLPTVVHHPWIITEVSDGR